MEKEIRTTLFINEQLSKKFRDACNKKFGDRQGKIKQGYVFAITNFCNEMLDNSESISIPPTLLAKKLKEDYQQNEDEQSVELDHDENVATNSEKLTAQQVVAKAKELAEERRKEHLDEHQILT